jgi:3-oxoacyl-[acyl-carrier-protein] synthase II
MEEIMERKCNYCLVNNHPNAYFCMNCGRSLVPTKELPDKNRVVITGVGIISALGLTVEENWASLLAGKSGVGLTEGIPNADKYPCNFSAEVKGFNPKDYMEFKFARRLTESSRYAVAAAKTAFDDSNLQSSNIDPTRAGVVIGTAAGGAIIETERAVRRFFDNKRISPIKFNSVWPNMAAFAVAHTFNFTGYNATIVTACASGTQSIATGADAIRLGYVDLVLAGGTESLNSEVGLAGFSGIGAVSKNRDEPQKASRPFDKNRDGLVPGEGSAFLVLENLEHARSRNAKIYVEILGYAVGSDARHETEPLPETQAFIMKSALKSAGITPENVDYINPHATSTPVGDAVETQSIKMVFGEYAYQIPISATKSMTGHMLGAAGSIEAIICSLSIRDGWVHPTINYETPDPECDLDYVPNQARKIPVQVALSNSFGFGGQNAAIVLGRL